jgi:arabinose-5-phosphate isomerase
MTGREESTLAQLATYTLDTMVLREADPLNLAPTASTTASLAMGDALACALVVLRSFSHHDFAQFHPSGALGKRLAEDQA